MARAPDLSIIIVNWNVRDLLRECLFSLAPQVARARTRFEVIVVDNASSDGSVDMLRAEFPAVRLLVSRENLGFAGGCEAGYQVARGRCILLLNPDTEVPAGAIGQMLADLDAHPRAAVVGSRLVNSDGSFQRAAGGAFPSLANLVWNYLFLHRLLPRGWGPTAVYFQHDPPGLSEVDWVSGAALLFRRNAVGERIFDPHYFLFGEDMDLCDRLRREGWQVLYSANQTIVHHHGQSLKNQPSMEVLANVYRGPRRFFRARHGRAATVVYDAILLAGYLIRWPLFGVLDIILPRRGYGDLSRFSRRYVWIMLQTMRAPG